MVISTTGAKENFSLPAAEKGLKVRLQAEKPSASNYSCKYGIPGFGTGKSRKRGLFVCCTLNIVLLGSLIVSGTFLVKYRKEICSLKIHYKTCKFEADGISYQVDNCDVHPLEESIYLEEVLTVGNTIDVEDVTNEGTTDSAPNTSPREVVTEPAQQEHITEEPTIQAEQEKTTQLATQSAKILSAQRSTQQDDTTVTPEEDDDGFWLNGEDYDYENGMQTPPRIPHKDPNGR